VITRKTGTFIKDYIEITESEHGIAFKELCPHATEVVQELQNEGFEAYIVGGGVRDLLLGKSPKDFDVATSATPEEVHDIFPRCRLIGRRFRLAHVRKKGTLTEVATFRGHHANSGDGQNSDGRILRDNVWGTVEEDAIRRDFTINALFLDSVSGTIRDYGGGYQDLKERRLRLIGDPELRYREDPVRLLRAARFVAKLDVKPDKGTSEPISRLAPLLEGVPPARLFEEVCKLFLTGHGLRSFEALQQFGLSETMFPAVQRGSSPGEINSGPLLKAALENTDTRIAQEKSITPAFLFAALLWHPMKDKADALEADGMNSFDAVMLAADEVFFAQSRSTAVPKRFSAVSKQIWTLQSRLQKTSGKRWKRIFSEPRFRAGYDFLLLRINEEPELRELGEFWTKAQKDVVLPSHIQSKKKVGRRRRSRPHRRSGTSS
jgi:poly(A) polymerase